MRTIKFRGKSNDPTLQNPIWVYGFLTVSKREICKIRYQMDDYTWIDETVIPETAGQFTGLFDRYGKEVYEGDIIAINTHYDNIVPFDFQYRYTEEKGKALYLVIWNERRCGFEMQLVSYTNMKPRSMLLNVYSAETNEIIGNIHDNLIEH